MLKKKEMYNLPVQWWLAPGILAIWETEIGRITVGGQPRQIVRDTPISKITTQNGLQVWLK
jgi:hypothetical protein